MDSSLFNSVFETVRGLRIASGHIPVRPVPHQSVEFGPHGGFPKASYKKYMKALSQVVRPPEVPIEGLLKVRFLFVFQAEEWAYRVGRGDLDNYGKPVQDALQRAGFFKNDAWIVSLQSVKIEGPIPEAAEGTYFELYRVIPGGFVAVRDFLRNLKNRGPVT